MTVLWILPTLWILIFYRLITHTLKHQHKYGFYDRRVVVPWLAMKDSDDVDEPVIIKKQLFALSKNFKWTFATSMWFILQVITESLPWQKGFYFLNSATKSGQTSYSVILGILQILQSSKTTISCMFIEVFKCYKCLMWAFSIYLLFLKFWNHSKIKVFLP